MSVDKLAAISTRTPTSSQDFSLGLCRVEPGVCIVHTMLQLDLVRSCACVDDDWLITLINSAKSCDHPLNWRYSVGTY